MVRVAGLWYLLASAYLVARLLSNRVLVGSWGVSTQLAVETAVIPLVQLGVLRLLRLHRSARSANGAGGATRPGADGA
jgi:hypothetical protein